MVSTLLWITQVALTSSLLALKGVLLSHIFLAIGT